MADKNDTGPRAESTDQLRRLSHRLRDQGVAPERDLWGDIDQAISAAEEHQIRPHRWRVRSWPQVAAMAAVLVLVLTAGWWALPPRTGPVTDRLPQIMVAEVVPNGESGLDVIAQALTELNQALAQDPDNRSLGSLSHMLHQRRGQMLRRNTEMRLNGS